MEVAPPGQVRMLLTSAGLSNVPFQGAFFSLLKARKPLGGGKVVYIPDALEGNGYPVQHSFPALQALLCSLGASSVECVELRRTTPEVLAQTLQGIDAIYVDMGNTFYLRHYMRTSGFDQLLPPLLKEGVVYVGASSGSVAVGQSVSTAFWKGWDNPGYGEEWDLAEVGYDGLGVIPGGKSVFPHFRIGEHEQLIQKRHASLGHDLLVLGDDHAYVVGGPWGAECIITATGEICNTSSTPQARASAARQTSSAVQPAQGASAHVPPHGAPLTAPTPPSPMSTPQLSHVSSQVSSNVSSHVTPPPSPSYGPPRASFTPPGPSYGPPLASHLTSYPPQFASRCAANIHAKWASERERLSRNFTGSMSAPTGPVHFMGASRVGQSVGFGARPLGMPLPLPLRIY